MAWYSAGGRVAEIGFATLSVATAITAGAGWRAAIQRRFHNHQRWMLRCYALLCSAVVIRIIGGMAEMLSVDWTYPYAAWISWLLPLAVLEISQKRNK